MLKKRNYLLIFALITLTLSLVDAWKLRDLSQKNDENKILPKKPIFRDIPMKKIVKVEKVKVSSDESMRSSEDNDAETVEDEDNFSFEKVHTTHFDLPEKPVITLSNPDVEQEEAERLEEADEENKVASLLSYLPSLNIFSEKVESSQQNEQENESTGYFGWLMGVLTGAKNKSIEEDNDADGNGDKMSDGNNWLSYLKSLNFFTELLTSVVESNSDDRKHLNKLDELITEKREPLSTQLFENLLLTIPSFIPNYTKISDIDCKRMGQIFQRQVRGQKLWALQMMDATAKIPSGLLRGNANQLGDFDLCTGVKTKVKIKDDKSVKIKGKYCLANIDIAAEDEQLKMSIHLVQGRNFLRSRLEDVSNFCT